MLYGVRMGFLISSCFAAMVFIGGETNRKSIRKNRQFGKCKLIQIGLRLSRSANRLARGRTFCAPFVKPLANYGQCSSVPNEMLLREQRGIGPQNRRCYAEFEVGGRRRVVGQVYRAKLFTRRSRGQGTAANLDAGSKAILEILLRSTNLPSVSRS